VRERAKGTDAAGEAGRDSGDRWPGRRSRTGTLPPRPVPLEDASDEAGGHDHEGPFGEEAESDGPRFAGDAELKLVADGTKELAVGDKGPAVKKVQEALHDLRFVVSVHGTFTAETETVVKDFQKQQKIAETGKVDKATYEKLEALFGSKKPYVEMAKQTAPGLRAVEGVEWDATAPPTPLDNWARNISADEAVAVADALSPTAKAGGVADPFKPDVGGVKYEDRLKALVDTKILEQWDRVAKGRADQHKDKSKLFSLDTAEDVGDASKKATDKVFGSWRVGPKLEAGTNLKDKFEMESDAIGKMDAGEKHAKAEWRVEKIIRTDTAVAALNAEHNVDRSRATEKGLIATVKSDLATKYEEKLLDIQRAWPASADPDKSEVHLQLFKAKTSEGNRAALWRMFGTLVHEYMHTLEHSEWRKWREGEGTKDASKGQTLLEGVTEFLTRVVLADVDPKDLKLRKAVEGTDFDEDADPPKVERTGYQADAERAEKVVGIVGVSNLYNAYFVGQTKFLTG
jgi:peptidoglycan hydrolase-like protein with peptidoglycan-binding domain